MCPDQINDIEESEVVGKFKSGAEKIAADPVKASHLVTESEEKAVKIKKARGMVDEIYESLLTTIRLVRAYYGGEYRQVPWKVIMAAVLALLYFLNPFDIVPDFLYILGFTDDAIVIAVLTGSISEHLVSFKAWEEDRVSPEKSLPEKC
ncbi:MAG: YkvA family protein [Chloroflexi bacterium]|nr:YkvA family protein [Chloroflexota bacterium]